MGGGEREMEGGRFAMEGAAMDVEGVVMEVEGFGVGGGLGVGLEATEAGSAS